MTDLQTDEQLEARLAFLRQRKAKLEELMKLEVQVFRLERGMGSSASVCVGEIINAACTHFAISREELLSRHRAEKVVRPRHIAYWLCRELLGLNSSEIGRHFGREHSAVLHGCFRTDQLIECYPKFREEVSELKRGLVNEVTKSDTKLAGDPGASSKHKNAPAVPPVSRNNGPSAGHHAT